jgi:hypothetical protein
MNHVKWLRYWNNKLLHCDIVTSESWEKIYECSLHVKQCLIWKARSTGMQKTLVLKTDRTAFLCIHSQIKHRVPRFILNYHFLCNDISSMCDTRNMMTSHLEFKPEQHTVSIWHHLFNAKHQNSQPICIFNKLKSILEKFYYNIVTISL